MRVLRRPAWSGRNRAKLLVVGLATVVTILAVGSWYEARRMERMRAEQKRVQALERLERLQERGQALEQLEQWQEQLQEQLQERGQVLERLEQWQEQLQERGQALERLEQWQEQFQEQWQEQGQALEQALEQALQRAQDPEQSQEQLQRVKQALERLQEQTQAEQKRAEQMLEQLQERRQTLEHLQEQLQDPEQSQEQLRAGQALTQGAEALRESRLNRLEKEDEAIEAAIRPGRVAFEPKRQMKVSEPKTVLVRISRNLVEDVRRKLERRERFVVEAIESTSTMGATLFAQTDGTFRIIPVVPEDGVQRVRQESFSVWIWQVTPLSQGLHKLILHVYALVDSENRRDRIPLSEHTVTIEVQAAPAAAVVTKHAQNFLFKVYDNFAKVLAAALLGVVSSLALYLRQRSKKKLALAKANTQDNEEETMEKATQPNSCSLLSG